MINLQNLEQRLTNFLYQRKNPLDLAIARIIFTSFFLWHFLEYSDHTAWFVTDWKSHWNPISFFKIIPTSVQSLELYTLLRKTMIISACFSIVGFCTQISLVFCFLSTLFILGFPFNFGKIHHNGHFLVMVMFFLSFTKNHLISVDFLIKKHFLKKRFSNLKLFESRCWPIIGIYVFMCTAYFESGFQKLRYSGIYWFHPDNLSLIILTRPSMTEFGRWVAYHPWLTGLGALITIVAEFGAPLALFNRKIYFLIGLSLFCFHFGTYFLLGAHGDFRTYSACFVFWVPWGTLYKKIKFNLNHFL